MPAALAVDWNEVRLLAITIGVREAARRMGLGENAVMQRSRREGWLAERHAAQAALSAEGREKTLATAHGKDVSDVRGIPKAAEILAQMPRTTKAVANSLALRALERLSQKDDDDLLSEVTTDVATKWIGNAAKAGSWDADAPKTALVSLSFNAAPLVPLEMAVDTQMEICPIEMEGECVDPMDDPAF